jgi:hypothetical protein
MHVEILVGLVGAAVKGQCMKLGRGLLALIQVGVLGRVHMALVRVYMVLVSGVVSRCAALVALQQGTAPMATGCAHTTELWLNHQTMGQ